MAVDCHHDASEQSIHQLYVIRTGLDVCAVAQQGRIRLRGCASVDVVIGAAIERARTDLR